MSLKSDNNIISNHFLYNWNQVLELPLPVCNENCIKWATHSRIPKIHKNYLRCRNICDGYKLQNDAQWQAGQ
jgi:hypothetical protein